MRSNIKEIYKYKCWKWYSALICMAPTIAVIISKGMTDYQ